MGVETKCVVETELVRSIAGRVGVMYPEKLAEVSPTAELFHNPYHPHTQALLSEIAALTEAEEKPKPSNKELEGEITSPNDAPSGCVWDCFTTCSL
jgi:oligopeptide/dipeptide ABC transporter ATP-binding protein